MSGAIEVIEALAELDPVVAVCVMVVTLVYLLRRERD